MVGKINLRPHLLQRKTLFKNLYTIKNENLISEKQLINDCQKGIKSSQYKLVRRYSGMLMKVSRRYVSDQASAKDVVQESFILIFRYIDKFKNTGSFEGWIRKITVRCALQWIGKSHFKKETSLTNLEVNDSVDPAIFNKLGIEEIKIMVAELPIGYRTVFNLNVMEGYNHNEIGELLGITESSSRSQLTRAKRLLKKKLESINITKYRSA